MNPIQRNAHGVPELKCRNDIEMYQKLGHAHGTDRALQILVTRILAEGRASEFLGSGEDLLEIDRFFRSQNWLSSDALTQEPLSAETLTQCQAYCDGLNEAPQTNYPWELKLLRIAPRQWDINSMLTMMKLVGFIGMAQSQSELERVVIEMVKNNVPRECLEELFPGRLEGLDIDLIKKTRFKNSVVPMHIKWLNQIPSFLASNNWVISGSRTASGRCILANDPHMEITRLPNIWAEINVLVGERWGNFMSMPGLPGFIIGRTPDLAWGVTYTYMDAADSWIEEIKDGKYRYGNEWRPLVKKTETIKRKNKPADQLILHSTHHGTIDGNVAENGYYLSSKWSCEDSGHRSLNSMQKMWRARDVKEGMAAIGGLEQAFNWVLADSQGNIGYQMSGLLPVKNNPTRSLAPLKGFEPTDDWQGYHPASDLPQEYNPERGYIVTANQDLNHLGKVTSINCPMGTYRADRIAELIKATPKNTVDSCRQIQIDDYSKEAALFLDLIKNLNLEHPNFHHLKMWDCRFHKESLGAHYFEKFYQGLYKEILGNSAMGFDVVHFLQNSTSFFNVFYSNFNRVFLSENSIFFAGRTRDEIYKKILLEVVLINPPQPFEQQGLVTLRHMLFGNKLPMILGFDRGPYFMRGSRGSPSQGQIFKVSGRLMSFAASIRFVTDFAEECTHTVVVGGPSDRRFSRFYNSETNQYFSGKLKINSRIV